MAQKFPIIGYYPVWPSRRIVKVKIELVEHGVYPFVVSSLEPTVKITDHGDGEHFGIASPEVISLYASRKQGEKDQLEKAHTEYAQLRRELRKAQRKYKWGLKMVAEYKKFKELQTPFFVE